MSLKSAATLAFIGTLLAAALLVWNFVFDVMNVIQGLVPAVRLFSSLIYAFAAVSLAVFFYVSQKTQR
jgi:phosphoglycerol transferase MdoB-like AlkP superfamily enzyme